jgi:hypothetical protein
MLAAQGITFTVNAPPEKAAESKEGAKEQKGKAR